MGMFNEMKTLNYWRAIIVELIGTTFFVYLVTTVLINLNPTTTGSASIVQIAFAIGLAMSVLAQIFGPISGGHFNPAVTVAVLIKGDIDVIKAILYTIAQIIGGIIGAAITYALTGSSKRGALGSLPLSPNISEVQGFFVELILTMLLVFTVLASTSTDNGRKDFGYANGLAIGISITVAHLVGIPYTGSGINPARAFGPNVVLGDFQSYHWIYWVGPYIGAVTAALLYRFVFGLEMEKKVVVNITDGNRNGITVTTQH